jgi:hypothetical protein
VAKKDNKKDKKALQKPSLLYSNRQTVVPHWHQGTQISPIAQPGMAPFWFNVVAEHDDLESPLPSFGCNSSFGVAVGLLGCWSCRVEAGDAAAFLRPRL